MRTMVLGTMAGALMLAGTTATASPFEGREKLAGVLRKARGSVVTIRAVLQIKGSIMGRNIDQETRVNGRGVVVDASGLVVASKSILKPQLRMGRRRMPAGSSFNATPISLKIVREGDETEHDAFQVATDSELGLTFLQIVKKPANDLAVLDLETTGKPEIGERVLLVTRLGKPFDYAPYLQETFIAGRIKKPRSAWILGGGLSRNNVLGLPVYNREGQLLGVFTTLTAETESGGERAGQFLLPPRPLKTAIGRALEKAKELLAGRDRKPGEKKADGDEGF